MARRFTILRGLPEEAAGPARRDRPGGRELAEAAKVEVETTELSRKDLGDVARDPSVAAFAPVMPINLIKPLASANGASSAGNWGTGAVRADQSSFDGTGIVPAVLDTGIDNSHPAFAGVDLVEKDFTGTQNGDGNGHGTHCAGTIFGRDVDGQRIGIARGVSRALIGKVLDDNGGGGSDGLYQGIQWALDNGARVVSMSLGFDFPGFVQQVVLEDGFRIDVATSLALEAYRRNLRMFDALMRIVEIKADTAEGAVVVAASGNESGRNESPPFEIPVSIPAAATGIVSVGALGQGPNGLEIAPFSNTLPVVAAPGVDIVSAAAGGGLVSFSGTSMATPHVAGVAALWWQSVANGGGRPTAGTVQSKLRAGATTDGLSPNALPADYGDGLVTAP